MTHRFFLADGLPVEPSERLPLSAVDVHHAVRVLRVHPGEQVEVVEPGGAAWLVEIVSAEDDGVSARLVGPAHDTGEFLPRVTLFQGVAKGDKMDSIVRQAVEVGAEKIVPLLTGRSVVRLDSEKRAAKGERWRRIARSAAEQAKRASVPSVFDALDLRDALSLLEEYDLVVVLWEEQRTRSLSESLSGVCGREGASVALVVGPEGGLSAEEVEGLVAHGAVTASLGPTVLRTETAAVVSVALALAALGGMGGRP